MELIVLHAYVNPDTLEILAELILMNVELHLAKTVVLVGT